MTELKHRCLLNVYGWPRNCGWALGIKKALLVTHSKPKTILYTRITYIRHWRIKVYCDIVALRVVVVRRRITDDLQQIRHNTRGFDATDSARWMQESSQQLSQVPQKHLRHYTVRHLSRLLPAVLFLDAGLTVCNRLWPLIAATCCSDNYTVYAIHNDQGCRGYGYPWIYPWIYP